MKTSNVYSVAFYYGEGSVEWAKFFNLRDILKTIENYFGHKADIKANEAWIGKRKVALWKVHPLTEIIHDKPIKLDGPSGGGWGS